MNTVCGTRRLVCYVNRRCKREACPAAGVALGPNPPTMRLDDGTAYRQTDIHITHLCHHKRLKGATENGRRYTVSGIRNPSFGDIPDAFCSIFFCFNRSDARLMVLCARLRQLGRRPISRDIADLRGGWFLRGAWVTFTPIGRLSVTLSNRAVKRTLPVGRCGY